MGMEHQKEPDLPDQNIRDVKTMIPFKDEMRNTHAQGGTKAEDSDDEAKEDNIPGAAQFA